MNPSSPTSQLEWVSGTSRLVDSAKTAHKLSAAQRTHAFDTQNLTDKASISDRNASMTALDNKIKESEYLCAMATKEAKAIEAEEKLLNDAMFKMNTAMKLLRDPVATAEHCKKLRTKRPAKEATRDHAERALNEQISGCSHSIRTLGTVCDGATREGARLMQCRETLERDISDKLQSIRLDREALHLKESNMISMKLQGRVRPSGHPLQWRLLTENLICDGQRTRASSERLRDRAKLLVSEASIVQKSTAEASLRALHLRSEEVDNLSKEVKSVLDGVCTELCTLEQAMDSVIISDQALEHPMAVAHARQTKRTIRPGPELVLDAAELSLEREITDLQRSRAKLQTQYDQQNGRFKLLEQSQDQMTQDIADKAKAVHIDLDCASCIESLLLRMTQVPPPLPTASGRASPTGRASPISR